MISVVIELLLLSCIERCDWSSVRSLILSRAMRQLIVQHVDHLQLWRAKMSRAHRALNRVREMFVGVEDGLTLVSFHCVPFLYLRCEGKTNDRHRVDVEWTVSNASVERFTTMFTESQCLVPFGRFSWTRTFEKAQQPHSVFRERTLFLYLYTRGCARLMSGSMMIMRLGFTGIYLPDHKPLLRYVHEHRLRARVGDALVSAVSSIASKRRDD